jgi:hypothetical protein
VKARRHHAAAIRAYALSICAIVFSSWASLVHATEPRSAAQRADRVVAHARELELWRDVAWLRLVHYRARTFGGVSSNVDDGKFFLSRNGRSDPRAELQATLRAFYRAPSKPADAHARCRFPARFDWLAERLGFAGELPPMRCPKLERYEARVTPGSVVLVYAANSVERPVSAFGHTFLVLRRAGQPRSARVVEFTADTDTDNPLLYAFKGIVGMFPGRFELTHYDDKLESYLKDQERDLWEYELALRKSELRRLARHLWELSTARFDYYYATKNCSYGVLALLEAAAPRLALVENTKFVVLPADTVKALFVAPGAVRSVRHLAARGEPAAESKSPHLGHGSMRVLFGVGYTSQYDDAFASFGYRIALHDLADPAQGQPELSQVQLLDVRLRYEDRQRRLTLNELTFAELTSLRSILRGPSPSWRVRAYGSRLRDAGCKNDDCFAHGLNGSLGFTLATSNERAAAFAMADAHLIFSPFSREIDGVGGSIVRAGMGPFAGIRIHAPDEVVTLLSGTWSYLPAQNLTSTYELRGTVRASLAPDAALGVETLVQPRAIEAQFLSYLYF